MVMIDEKGHPKEWCYFEHCSRCGAVVNDQEEECPEGCENDDAYVPSWNYEASQFYDLILTGDLTDEFWKSLLQ